MFSYFVLAYHLAREAMREGKLGEMFAHQAFRNRLIIPVEMDLLGPLPKPTVPAGLHVDFIEYQLEDVRTGKWRFPVSSRRVKASRNLERGLRGFAVVQNGIVMGDLWCLCRRAAQEQVSHPDFKMLDIVCQEREAYAFDMFIDPGFRGKNLAVPLQRFLQHTLKGEGYLRVYGAYYEDNLPALWMHRMLKFKEHPKRKVTRFFSFLKSTMADTTSPSPNISMRLKGDE